MFAHKLPPSGQSASRLSSGPTPAGKSTGGKGDEEEEGEDFDLDAGGARREGDWDVVDLGEADRHMRELLEQALGDVEGEFTVSFFCVFFGTGICKCLTRRMLTFLSGGISKHDRRKMRLWMGLDQGSN